MIRTKILLACAGFSLIGCVAQNTPYDEYLAGNPLQNYAYKAGVSPSEMQNNLTDCEIEAARRVPQNMVIRTTPSYTSPTRSHCNRIGSQMYCNTSGGQTYGGNISSYDANYELRIRAYGQCMTRKGYHFETIPACPKDADISGQNEKFLRPLSSRTCYKYYEDGRFEIGDG